MNPFNYIFILFYLVNFSITAQNMEFSQGAEPVGGIEQLALEYYKINFTRSQRAFLQGMEVEFIYLIDTVGVASLQAVKGISEPEILDSLKSRKDLPQFLPARKNNVKESSLYFMKLTFPEYQRALLFNNPRRFGRLKMDDVEYIERSGSRMEALIGVIGNTFAGSPSRYLAPGGGMKIDVIIKGRNKMGYGIGLALCGNYMKKDYPIQTTRAFESAPPIGFISLIISRQIFRGEKKELNIQLEPAFASQTLSAVKYKGDQPLQAEGFSPGLIVNYFIRLGNETFGAQWNGAYVGAHHLNFHAGIRPMLLNIKPARGVMFELGISWRLTSDFVRNYKLKEI